MRLNDQFVAHVTDSEAVLVALGGTEFNGIVRGNRTFGAMLKLLQEDVTEADMVRALCERYDVEQSVAAADVARAVSELRRVGALDD